MHYVYIGVLQRRTTFDHENVSAKAYFLSEGSV
jgi:hypothetical protein